MDKSNTINLIAKSYKADAIGQRVPQESSREVFCSVFSVSGAEFLDAGRSGIRAAYKITMYAPDYAGEEIAELDGTRFAVYRTYLAKNEQIELYLEKKAGV